MIRPKALKLNDKIGIVAPAGPYFDKVQFKKSIEKLKSIGFIPILGKSCFSKYGFLAGDDKVRAKDVNLFFEAEDIKAVMALRGGYGSMRILNSIDYKLVKKNPKIFIGYSDITALHSAINRYSKLITFHGPMLYSDFHNIDKETLLSFIENIVYKDKAPIKKYKLEPIVSSNLSIEGEIFGGNLSVLTSLLGSIYQVDYKGKILFLEEINEEPYKVDRMLYQMYLAGIFKQVKCVILGQFTNCNSYDEDKSHSLEYVLNSFLKGHSIVSYRGLSIGHERSKITMPLGIKCEISECELRLSEKGVI